MHQLSFALLEITKRIKRHVPWLSYEKRFRFQEIERGKCYRSSQLTIRAWRYFWGKYKFRSAIILLSAPKIKKDELSFIDKNRLNLLNIQVFGRCPKDKEIEAFFSFLDNPENQPALIHCSLGRDRTGFFSLLYRIERMSWDIERAWEEMKLFGHRSLPWRWVTDTYFRKWLEDRYSVKLKD